MNQPVSRHRTVRDFEEAYPWIDWREPIRISRRDATTPYFGCRVCIGMNGLRGNEVETLPKTRQEWERHFVANHGKVVR